MSPAEEEELALKDIAGFVLEEARMVLPGIQALFGFQLIAVFNNRFESISNIDKNLHLLALILTIAAIGCLMAPASYHRQVERYTASRDFVKYASKLLCIGMAPLLLSISLDTYVVCNIITSNQILASVAGLAAFIFLATMWYLIPILITKKAESKSSTVVA